jgi:two-component system phosphate regulon response regulator PhoB
MNEICTTVKEPMKGHAVARESILIVEDEEDLLELLRFNLSREGYQVTGVTTGEEALEAVQKQVLHLILLDLLLPGIDGLEVAKRIRGDQKIRDVPIVMLTAKGEEADIVTGLELGADDYIAKPFSPRVLIARLRAVLRRRNSDDGDDGRILAIRDLIIHPGRHEVLLRGKEVKLTFTEYRILELLAGRPGWVFSRAHIIDSVRGKDYAVTDRAVDVQIAALRRKLGNASKHIETVRGVGYRFQV